MTGSEAARRHSTAYASHVLFVLSQGQVRDESVTKSLCSEAAAIVTADIFAQLDSIEGARGKIRAISQEFKAAGLGGAGSKLGTVLYKVSQS